MPTSFSALLRHVQTTSGSVLCVGLDPDPALLPEVFHELPPEEAVAHFCTAIIAATQHVACAYKPNFAFFEALGLGGWRALEAAIRAVPADRVVVGDAKRGDIGNTAARYAAALYDTLGCHAATVAPYMGRDSITPFLQHAGRAAFVLVATSNPGHADLQARSVDGRPLYAQVAALAVACAEGQPGDLGFVVGATRPRLLADLRASYPNVPFLVPGVGAQGGTAAETLDAAGSGPLLVNVSRQILYASRGADFAVAARQAAEELAAALAYH